MTTEQRLIALEERNRRVEADKAWETSAVRRTSLVVLTYLVMNAFLFAIGVRPTYVHALVPTLGFFLSTLTLGWLKQAWLKKRAS